MRNAYLQLSEAYDDAGADAAALGWAVRRHEGTHLSMVTEPETVGDHLIAMLER